MERSSLIDRKHRKALEVYDNGKGRCLNTTIEDIKANQDRRIAEWGSQIAQLGQPPHGSPEMDSLLSNSAPPM